jgi:hypothetical protein
MSFRGDACRHSRLLELVEERQQPVVGAELPRLAVEGSSPHCSTPEAHSQGREILAELRQMVNRLRKTADTIDGNANTELFWSATKNCSNWLRSLVRPAREAQVLAQ